MKKSGNIHEEEEDNVELVSEDADSMLSEKLSKLKRELKTCSRDRKEYLEGWQRAKADLINTKRILEQEHKEKMQHMEEEILLDLLPVLDSFEMAFADKKTWESVNADWRIGIEHIYNKFVEVLAGHGILSIDPKEERFDPKMHESVEVIPTKKKSEEGLIVHVLQKGYRLRNRIVRPAKVKIATYVSEN